MSLRTIFSTIVMLTLSIVMSGCGPIYSEKPPRNVGLLEENNVKTVNNAEVDDSSGLELSEISGFVWSDSNENGLQDEQEFGVSAVRAALRRSNGVLLNIVYTDSEGYFTFANIHPGEYYLGFTTPAEETFTIHNAGNNDSIDSDADSVSGISDGFTVSAESYTVIDVGVLLNPEETQVNNIPQIVGPSLNEIPEGYSPITGLPVDDPELLALRPVFISISHFPPSQTRPPTGISFSPYVVELSTLHGQTRLFVLFWGEYPNVETSDPNAVRIEGVRSGRVFYEDFRRQFSACTITGGADPKVASQIYTCAHASTTNPDDIGAAGLTINRLQSIAKQSAIGIAPPNLSGNMFDPAIPTDGQQAPTFWMFYNKFNQTKWVYDAELGGYLRYQNSIAEQDVFTLSTDRLTGEPIVRENVIVLFTKHHVLNEAATIVDIDLEYNRGRAVLFRDGMMYNILWDTVSGEYEKETGRLRPIRFTDLNGNPFPMKPGTFWINVVDLSTGFWEPEPGYWKARFYEPEYEGG